MMDMRRALHWAMLRFHIILSLLGLLVILAFAVFAASTGGGK